MRKHRTKVAVLVAIMLGAWGFQTGHAAGDVSCRASVVHVKGDPSGPLSSLDVELVVANAGDPSAPGSPCAAQTSGVSPSLPDPLNGETLELPSGLGTVRAAWAETTFSEFSSAGAAAGVANVHLTLPGLPTIDAEVLTSSVTATCDENNPDAPPTLTSEGEVARVSVAGGDQVWVPAGGASESRDIAGVATLHLNKVDSSANSVTRRALFLDTGLVDVTISEASVGFTGTPCAEPPPPTQCNDGVDNADTEDELADEADPGCHNDGDATNPNSYDPLDDDETDVAKPECSDGVDNDDPEDTLVDMNDPGCSSPTDDDETNAGGPQPECSDGVDNDDPEDTAADTNDPDCHTDFDPNNSGSYDPNDDSEGCDEVPPDPESSRDSSGDQEDDLGELDDEDCQGAEGPPRD